MHYNELKELGNESAVKAAGKYRQGGQKLRHPRRRRLLLQIQRDSFWKEVSGCGFRDMRNIRLQGFSVDAKYSPAVLQGSQPCLSQSWCA